MSTMPEDIKKTLICCVNRQIRHYAFEAIFFPCGGSGCKKCIQELEENETIECGFCECDHRREDMMKMPINPHVKSIIRAYLGGLREELVNDLNENTIKDLTQERMNEDVDLRFSNVEFELDTRIESIMVALHEYRDEFKAEMDTMKEKYKSHLKSKGFLEMKKELDSLNKDTLATDYDDFMRTHNLIIESKKKLQSYLQQLNEIKLNADDIFMIRCKDLIGELVLPFWKKAEHSFSHNIESANSLYRFCHLKSKNELLLIDQEINDLITYKLNDCSEDVFELENVRFPIEICTGKYDQIFILDMPEEEDSKIVLVFGKELNYKRKFKTNSLGVHFMSIDVNSEPNLLYLSHLMGNQISVWNSETGESTKTIQIDSPEAIVFTKEFIYVASYTDYETYGEDKFERIISGANCIFVLNKQTHEVVDRISFDTWLRPYGLSLDDKGNLLTTARELDKNKIISSNFYLYVISPNKEIIQKLKLKKHYVSDYSRTVFFNNNLAVLKESEVKMIPFSDYFF